jgi:dolichol-phosphate mannosyltransferase
MKRVIVVIPTYNEKETLPCLIDSVLKNSEFDILVVDDSSPDGTASVVKQMMPERKGLFLIERIEKLGLGTAYIEGFKWGLAKGYDYFFEMDADSSHDPNALPLFIEEMGKGCSLVIGSRYLNGKINVVGWDFSRLLLSKFGNLYASVLLGLRLSDLTSGFRCYSKEALESVDLDAVRSEGYAFQIEMAYRVSSKRLTIGEIPIIFYERASGSSKMSKKIVWEAVVLPWKVRFKQILKFIARSS